MRYYNTESRICLQNIDLFVFCVYNQIVWEISNEREFSVMNGCKLWKKSKAAFELEGLSCAIRSEMYPVYWD